MTALETACELFASVNVRPALIGGHAVNLYARPRSTMDVDFLADSEDAEVLRATFLTAGFEILDWRDDLGSVVRDDLRIDLIFARRPYTRSFLESARVFENVPCRVATPDALIALKLQAFNNDPRRLQDLVDIKALIDACQDTLDLTLLADVFALFKRQELFNDLLGGLS